MRKCLKLIRMNTKVSYLDETLDRDEGEEEIKRIMLRKTIHTRQHMEAH